MMEGGAELNIHNVAYTETHMQPMLVLLWRNAAMLSIFNTNDDDDDD